MKSIFKCKPSPAEIKFGKFVKKTKKLSYDELVEEGDKAFEDAVRERRKKREYKKRMNAQAVVN